MAIEPGPGSFTLVGVAAAALGPILGPYVLIAFAAVVGSLLAMSAQPTKTRWEGVKFVLLGVLVAILITGPAVWVIQALFPAVPANIALIPVALAIGAARHLLLGLIEGAMTGLATVFSAMRPKGGDK